jgi:hypothetical protein
MEQNSQISMLPAGSGTITAMSGGGNGLQSNPQSGGAKPFNLKQEGFDKWKGFLQALTDKTTLTYDSLKVENSPEYADCKRTILKKLTPHLQDILNKKDKGGITIEISFTPTVAQ